MGNIRSGLPASLQDRLSGSLKLSARHGGREASSQLLRLLDRQPSSQRDQSQQQPGGAALLHSGYQRSDEPDRKRRGQRPLERAADLRDRPNGNGDDNRGQKESAQAAGDSEVKSRVVRCIDGRNASRADKRARPRAEERRAHKGMPAGPPYIPPLVEVAALKLFGDSGQALIGSARNGKPQTCGQKRQRQHPGQHSARSSINQQDAAARQRHNGRQEPSAGGREQNSHQSQRQIAGRQQTPGRSEEHTSELQSL